MAFRREAERLGRCIAPRRNERQLRPALDLLTQIPLEAPATVHDLAGVTLIRLRPPRLGPETARHRGRT